MISYSNHEVRLFLGLFSTPSLHCWWLVVTSWSSHCFTWSHRKQKKLSLWSLCTSNHDQKLHKSSDETEGSSKIINYISKFPWSALCWLSGIVTLASSDFSVEGVLRCAGCMGFTVCSSWLPLLIRTVTRKRSIWRGIQEWQFWISKEEP